MKRYEVDKASFKEHLEKRDRNFNCEECKVYYPVLNITTKGHLCQHCMIKLEAVPRYVMQRLR